MSKHLPFFLAAFFLFSIQLSASRYSKVDAIHAPTISLEKHIKIYPNPVTDYAFVGIDNFEFEKLEVRVLDILGNTLIKKDILMEAARVEIPKIDMSALHEGVYLIEILDRESKKRHTQRLVKR